MAHFYAAHFKIPYELLPSPCEGPCWRLSFSFRTEVLSLLPSVLAVTLSSSVPYLRTKLTT